MTGQCQCGCGKQTSVAKRNDHKRGVMKGEHYRFCRGHRENQGRSFHGYPYLRYKDKEARRRYAREWARKNPARPETQKRARLKRKYGITLAQFDALLEAQGGVCAICQGPPKGDYWGSFHVDHDHESGRVRGLLCSFCNRMLGMARDDVDVLTRAAEYLTSVPK